MSRVRIGVSGWRYPPWRGVFYPKKLAQRKELTFIGETFDTVEINGSFYSLQTPSSYRMWRASVPPDFVFAVKGSRFITHMKRLRGVEIALANFFASGVLALGESMGPILWQLPARATFDEDLLRSFLAQLPRTTDDAARLAKRHDDRIHARAVLRADARRPILHALEPRHPSFGCETALRLLREYDVAMVVSDTAQKFPMFDHATASFSYVRLHGDTEIYKSGYSEAALASWASRIDAWRKHGDVYVYFDNDMKVHAPFDALALRDMVDGKRSAAMRSA